MKPRQPLFITIIIVEFIITFAFAMLTNSYYFFSNLIYWLTIGLGILNTCIINSIEKLIDIKKYNLLTESEKNQYNYLKSIPYFETLRKSALDKQDDIEEKSITIDHGFDGIIELDNVLPKWWISLFYFGIIFCILYIFLFFATDKFANPQYELELEIRKAKKQQDDYWSKVLQPNVETVKLNQDYIEEGKELFNNNCSSCHNKDGLGGIGPNLTDQNWINVEQKSLIKNIFYLVWYGSKNNATMRAFGSSGELNGIQIEKIANYIYHLNQVKYNHKKKGAAPQGKKVIWEASK